MSGEKEVVRSLDEKPGGKEGQFETQLFEDEMRYILGLMPKSFSLMKSSKLAKTKGTGKVAALAHAETRRFRRR